MVGDASRRTHRGVEGGGGTAAARIAALLELGLDAADGCGALLACALPAWRTRPAGAGMRLA